MRRVVAAAAAHMAQSPKWSAASTALKRRVFDKWWLEITDGEIYNSAGDSIMWLARGLAALADKLLASAALADRLQTDASAPMASTSAPCRASSPPRGARRTIR